MMYSVPPTLPALQATVPQDKRAIVLSLEDAVALALRQNPTLLAATARIEESTGRIAEARANLRPSLTVTGTITGFDRQQTGGFTVPGIGSYSFVTARRDQSQAVLGADMPLDFAGQIRSSIRLAEVGRDATRFTRQSTQNQVITDVRDAYYTVLQAQELVKVAEESVRNAEERERTAESYVRAGTATRFESLRAATATADARQNVLVARNQVTLALAALANTLGLQQTADLAVTSPEDDIGVFPTFTNALEEAEQRRPELLAATAQVRSARLAVRLAELSDAPTVGVGAQYQHSPRANFGQAKDLSAVSVNVRIPLFDRGISRARLTQTHAQVETAEQSYLAVRNAITLEVRQAVLRRQEAEDRLNVAAAALTQAEEQYRLAQNRYKAGVNLRGDFSSPLLEISDAQTALTQAQTNAVNARFDVLRTQSRLGGALGRYSHIQEVKP
jgi:outer membrane protein TolC